MSKPVVIETSQMSPTGLRGLRLGSVGGVTLFADISLLIIFALIAANLGLGVLPRWHPDWSPGLIWAVAVGSALMFLASVALHELSHAWVGATQGVTVRRITLFVFGGMAHMENEPSRPRAELLMAIVGPLVSIALGLLCVFIAGALTTNLTELYEQNPVAALRAIGPVATMLFWIGPINLLLGVFNLVPGFPLDGGRVLRAFLWAITHDLRKATRWAAGVGQGFAWLLMALGVTMLFGWPNPVFGANPVQGIWLLLIGWFLNSAARASLQQVLIRQAFGDVPVRELMRSRFDAVDPATSLAEFVHGHVLPSDNRTFPVAHDGEIIGLVTMNEVRSVAADRWHETLVRDVMTPVERLHTVGPNDSAIAALRELAEQDAIPVVEGKRLVGLTRRDDFLRWLTTHAAT